MNTMTKGADGASSNNQLSLPFRLGLLLGAWGIALASMAIPDPQALRLGPFMPLGVLLLFTTKWPTGDSGFALALCLGWSVYVLITGLACFERKKRNYLILYTILFALLALNVVGCHLVWPINM